MKIEIGDYIRTCDGFIGKVKSIEPIEIGYNHYHFENTLVEKCDQDIMRVQKRPIDLIMEGDYVNGGLVEQVNYAYIIVALPDYEEWQTITNDDIKTIVTKEQFERMMYNVR